MVVGEAALRLRVLEAFVSTLLSRAYAARVTGIWAAS